MVDNRTGLVFDHTNMRGNVDGAQMTKSFNCMRIHISISTLLVTVYRRHSDTQLLPVVVANLKGYSES